jgi:hypothetical protein
MGAFAFKAKFAYAAFVFASFYPGLAYCDPFDLIPANPFKFESVQPSSSPNSIFVFGGAMSTAGFADALVANAFMGPHAAQGHHFDNSIVGAAYDRDLYSLGHGLILGAEVGAADRFGDYQSCCTTIVMSGSTLHTGEFWGGPQIRYTGVDVFNMIHIGGAVTVGLSAVTGSIGREEDRVASLHANAHLLYYLGPEIDLSIPSLPGVELVLKVQHRSGAKALPFLPTLGRLEEAYNGDVIGIRYRF